MEKENLIKSLRNFIKIILGLKEDDEFSNKII